MKICMFTNTYLPHVGGVARSVDFFAKDLRKMGYRVLVVASTFPAETAGCLPKMRQPGSLPLLSKIFLKTLK
jgi:hypothetical protein